MADIAVAEPLSPLRYLAHPAPVEQVMVRWGAGELTADFYGLASDDLAGGLLLVPGYPANTRDPQLTQLAEGIARLGVAVLVPQLPGLSAGELTSRDVDGLVAAAEWLRDRPEVDDASVGLAGFCVGSSLALIAAGDPRINPDVAAVHVFGGYYDLREYLRAIATGVDEAGEQWSPAEAPVKLFAHNLIAMVEPADERGSLALHLAQPQRAADPPEKLSPVARSVYTLLTSRDGATINKALLGLPPKIQRELDLLSPRAMVAQVQARVFIMHDRDDPYVPVSEAMALHAALQGDQVVYTEFSFLSHVRPDPSTAARPLVADYARLVLHLAPFIQALTPDRDKSP